MTFNEVLEYNFLQIGQYSLNLLDLIEATIILVVGRLFLKGATTLLKRIFRNRKVDVGRQFAFLQFLRYIVYVFMIILILQSLGVNISLLLAGSAALLVGIGLGLQSLFANLVAGIILLVEGTVEVGDIVEVDNIIGRVQQIGIRTCKVEVRDDNTLIVPNSHLVSGNVVNWNYNHKPSRFHIDIGVSYLADPDQVTKVLMEVAGRSKHVEQKPGHSVFFIGYGASSLDFKLYFFSFDFWNIERVKSDLRYDVFRAFKEHNIEIPFPQQDVWFRNALEVRKNNETNP